MHSTDERKSQPLEGHVRASELNIAGEVWKDCHSIKIEEPAKRITSGLVTVGSVDSDGEVVDQQTVLDAMPRYMKAGGPVMWNHGMGGNIGRCLEYTPVRRAGDGWVLSGTADAEAVRVITEYGKGYEIGTMWGPMKVDDIWARIEQGMERTHSINMLAKRVTQDNSTAPRLKVHRVLEYSVVTVPAQEEAVFEVQRMAWAVADGKLCEHCTEMMTRRVRDAALLRAVLDQARHELVTAAQGRELERFARAFHDAAKRMRG